MTPTVVKMDTAIVRGEWSIDVAPRRPAQQLLAKASRNAKSGYADVAMLLADPAIRRPPVTKGAQEPYPRPLEASVCSSALSFVQPASIRVWIVTDTQTGSRGRFP